MQENRTECGAQQTRRSLSYDRAQMASVLMGVGSVLLITYALQMILSLVFSALAPSLFDRDWFSIVFSTLPMYAVAMPLSLLFFGIGKAETPREGMRLSVPALLGLLAICFGLSYAGSFLGNAANAILSLLRGEPVVNRLQELTAATPLWANLLFCGILAPVLEEIFYRKLVIDRLRGFGDLPAILISGILFGLIHGNFGQLFYAVAVGLLLGCVYVKTGRLRYTVGLHMAVNLVGGVFTAELSRHLDVARLTQAPLSYLSESPVPVIGYLLYEGFLLACLIGTPIALVLFARRTRLSPASEPLPKGWGRSVLLKNPALWFFLVACALLWL